MPDARIYRSIHEIGQARWDACCPGALEGFDYLAAIEAAGLPGFDWRYVAIEERGEPQIVAPAFFTDYLLDTTLADFGRRAIGAVRRIAPRAFTLKLGAIGSPCTETAGVGFHVDVPQVERSALMRRAIDAFGVEANREGCGLTAIKDAPGLDNVLWTEAAEPLGFKKSAGLPTASLDIDFADMDAYLATLSASTRKDMRRKLKSLASIDIAVRVEIDDIAERVLELYRMTRSRADMQFEDLTQAYFTGVLRQMPRRSLCVTYSDRQDGSLLAANLLIHDDATLLDKFFCMDTARGRERNLYFISWFTNVRLCLERGWTVYQSGQAGYANKLKLGSRLSGASMYYRHRNRLVNFALGWAAPLLSEDQPEAA